MKKLRVDEPRSAMVLMSISGLLLLGKAADICILGLSYTYIFEALICIALASGLVAGLVSPYPISLFELFLLWLPGAVLFQLFIGYEIVWHRSGFSAWQFVYGYPLHLAATGAVAASIAGRARREERYAQLLLIPAIGAFLWRALVVIDALTGG